MSKFKVGDKIRIKDNMKILSFDDFIEKTSHLGEIAIIKKVISNYELDIDDGKVYWQESNLESITCDFETDDIVEIKNGILKGIKGKVIDTNCQFVMHSDGKTPYLNEKVKIKLEDETKVEIKKDNLMLVKKNKLEGEYNRKEDDYCKYIINRNDTTVILPSGIKGQVKLYKGDKYDMELGLKLAYYKAKFNEVSKEIKAVTK